MYTSTDLDLLAAIGIAPGDSPVTRIGIGSRVRVADTVLSAYLRLAESGWAETTREMAMAQYRRESVRRGTVVEAPCPTLIGGIGYAVRWDDGRFSYSLGERIAAADDNAAY